MSEVHWLTDFDEACNRAKGEGKFVLIDFYDPA